MAKKTIGFLTFDAAGTYNFKMWKHLVQQAEKLDINLVTFCGGGLHSVEAFQDHWNKIYDLAISQHIDGLIVLSSTITHSCRTEDLIPFLARFKNKPIVSLALEVPDIHSVIINNESGMKKIVEHMVLNHRIKKPVFLMGPPQNDEAQIRLKAFEDVMREHKIPVNPLYIRNADYRYDYAAREIEFLLKEKLDFDSVIAVNDDMAMGAIDTLHQYKKNIPGDVVVSGFDDSEAAPYCLVPLTTVSQPHEQLALRGLEILSDLIQGKDCELVTSLDSELVVRKSCGCLAHSFKTTNDFNFPVQSISQKDFLERNIFRNKNYKPLFEENKLINIESQWNDALWLEFTRFINSGIYSDLLISLDQLVRTTVNEDKNTLNCWHNLVSAWHYICMEQFKGAPVLLRQIEECFNQARLILFDMEKGLQANKMRLSQQENLLLLRFNSYFSSFMDIDNFLNHLNTELPQFGITDLYVNIFEKDVAGKCRHFMNFTSNGTHYWNNESELMDSAEILPDGLLATVDGNFIVEPLINYEELIGFFTFKCRGPIDLIENIRQIVSNSLISIMLVQEVMKDKQLKILMSNLQQKQRELEAAYKSLQENQKTMLIIEKMASLGRMTAGIAHEMNSPLAAVRASLTELHDLINEYSSSIGDTDVSLGDHKDIANEMERSLSLAEVAATKAASFVHGIKSQTRDLSPKDRFNFNAVSVIDEALLLLGHSLKHGNCAVEFIHESDYIELLGVPGRMAQVITNMITNSIDACDNRKGSKIILELTVCEIDVCLKIKDNGDGIPIENMTKIFDPMFTSKAFGVGTGLGLTLVHDIVTVDFGGVINVDSVPGEGTVFTLKFPAVREV